jgi:glutamate N-acetyltransferase/amino-acid N-acetyltransferase
MVQTTADELGIEAGLVSIASTGIIGVPLPMEKIKKAIPDLVWALPDSSLSNTAHAIMTTDTFPKVSMTKIKIGRATGTIAGIAKGAGMICPDMATMLCFMFTDISVHHSTLHFALQRAVNKSFNMLSVDNDMSTNDTVMIMANGILGNTPLKKSSRFYNKFEQSLSELTDDLSRMIAEDGEGATKIIEIIVKGAKTDSAAKKVAKAVSTSMLVKTAIYGKDPNWGRIMAAVGYSNVKIIEQKINISINNIKLVSKGVGIRNDKIAKKVLAKKDITITIDLGMGKKTSKSLTCDLTDGYIRINAAYRT